MLLFERKATVKSIYYFRDTEEVILTVYFYIDGNYCEHQMEFTLDELIEDKDFPEYIDFGFQFNIEIQIFTGSKREGEEEKEKEIMTVRKVKT
jgi:hypothetical protein